MKTACIYHSVDLDGWMSAAIVKHWFVTEFAKGHSYVIDGTRRDNGTNPHDAPELDFIGYNYGQPIPDLSEYHQVIMCDISFKLTTGQEIDKISPMFDLIDKFKENFIWIDHHSSAINDVNDYADEYDHDTDWPVGLQNAKFAACELTWMYFFPNEPMPEMVRLLGRYDCFGNKGTDEEKYVLEFQYGARSVISNYNEAYSSLITSIRSGGTGHGVLTPEFVIHRDGVAIYKLLCTEAKQSYANGFVIEFQLYPDPKDPNNIEPSRVNGWRKFLAINKERFNPVNFDIDYHKDGYDGIASFHYDKSLWKFSLYNDNGLVDCSVIAKQFGGGGHKGASGFILTRLSDIMPNMI